MKDLLLSYVKYNLWANQRVCNFLKNNLSEEQFEKEIISSFPSIKKTLLHIWDAQFLWLKRLEGISLTSFPSKDFKGTFNDAIDGLLKTSQQMIDVIDNSNEEKLAALLTYKSVAGDQYENTTVDILLHVSNHGTFHRGQVITMLRQLGFTKLFPTDYIAFFR